MAELAPTTQELANLRVREKDTHDNTREAEEEVMKLVEAAEVPGTALVRLFEEEVVPPTPTVDAGDPEF